MCSTIQKRLASFGTRRSLSIWIRCRGASMTNESRHRRVNKWQAIGATKCKTNELTNRTVESDFNHSTSLMTLIGPNTIVLPSTTIIYLKCRMFCLFACFLWTLLSSKLTRSILSLSPSLLVYIRVTTSTTSDILCSIAISIASSDLPQHNRAKVI